MDRRPFFPGFDKVDGGGPYPQWPIDRSTGQLKEPAQTFGAGTVDEPRIIWLHAIDTDSSVTRGNKVVRNIAIKAGMTHVVIRRGTHSEKGERNGAGGPSMTYILGQGG